MKKKIETTKNTVSYLENENEIERLEEALIQANKTIASIRALVQNNESSNLYTINKKIV